MTTGILIGLFAVACVFALLMPALLTGDWHADRMDRIERGDT